MHPITALPNRVPKHLNPRRPNLPMMIWGSSLPMKRSHNAERCQCCRERRQQATAVTIPSPPLDLSCVSYNKCVASLQRRLGPVQADDELDPAHIQASVDMNNISDAPIIGHTLENFKDAQKINCKNS